MELNNWVPIKMIVDTGADYTLLPLWLQSKLGMDLKRDCKRFKTSGVGGEQWVYLVSKRWKIKIGEWEENITLGFLNDNLVPPLLGRSHCLERIKVSFEDFMTTFGD